MSSKSICIPISKTNERVVIFVDELEDIVVDDLLDILRGEMAPLTIWKECAIEYHRQNFSEGFDSVLDDIVDSVSNEDVRKAYQDKSIYTDFGEAMGEIFNVLAAKAFDVYCQQSKANIKADTTDVLKYLKKVEDYIKVSEYSWLIKGFYEIKQGDLKRAMDNFKLVLERANTKNLLKKKYLFGGLIGYGIIYYLSQKYTEALDHFIRAIQSFPCENASIRVAIAACYYKLENYDRSNLAIDAALHIDCSNSYALALKALLLQIDAQKCDRTKQSKLHLEAFENCVMASTIDPSCTTALIQMANHLFHTWKRLSIPSEKFEFEKISDDLFKVSADIVIDQLHVGDLIRFNSSNRYSYIVQDIDYTQSDYSLIKVEKKIDSDVVEFTSLESRDLHEVNQLINKAISGNNTTTKEIKAESYYIQGKVYHAQGNIDRALWFYLKSLEISDMILAAFGAAQIRFSKGEFVVSLKLFEGIQQKYPNDKDTQAYICLLKGVCKKEIIPFETLREVTPGFQHQGDLWLIQGELRLNDSNLFPQASKCLMSALECFESNHHPIPSSLLSNIAVLSHSLGKFNIALNFIKRALTLEHILSSESDDINPYFKSFDLENVLYSWNTALCKVRYDDNNTDNGDMFISQNNEIDMTEHLVSGEDVLIDDILYRIKSVQKDSFKAYSPILRRSISSSNDTANNSDNIFELKTKQKWRNFYTNVTGCFNLARILEASGSTSAATEIYIQLLKQHPSFIECYLRLSEIARDMGNFSEASLWLKKALNVDDNEPDVNISVGDLYQRGMLMDEAKKSYEKVCSKNHHDSRGMISLGNFYFSTLNTKDNKYEAHLKDSYKFFYAAASEDTKNIYAINGLGMICAEKGILQVSKDIFTRAREESSSMAADIGINLAHVHQAQQRFVDAEHLYQAMLKTLVLNCRVDKMVSVYEWTALAQVGYNRMDSSIMSLLNGLHLNPLSFRLWFNLAVVNRDSALSIKNKVNRSVDDIQGALENIDFAHQLFSFFYKTSTTFKREPQYERSIAEKYAKATKEIKYEMKKVYEDAVRQKRRIDEEKQKKENEHEAWKNNRQRQVQEEQSKEQDETKQLKERASLKQKRLEEMTEKWTSSQISKSSSQDIDVDDEEQMQVAVDENEKKLDLDENRPIQENENENLFGNDDDDDDDILKNDEEMFQPTNKRQKIDDLFGSDDEDDEDS